MKTPRQNGFSLVELMVALVVGLVLTAGVIQIFVANKQTYRVADASARIQENARFALEILSHQIRIAGYRSNVTQDTASSFPVFGNTGTLNGAFTLPGQIISGMNGASDNLTIRFFGNDDTSIKNCTGTTVLSNQISNQRFFVNNSVLNCGAEVFAQDGTSIKGYNAQPLIEGIENMQVLYGIDTDNDKVANQFVPANNVVDWNQVVSVRISLLLHSIEDNITTSPQLYTFNGAPIVPTDNRLRRVYTVTIALRNRLP